MSELHKFLFEGLPVRGMLVRVTDGVSTDCKCCGFNIIHSHSAKCFSHIHLFLLDVYVVIFYYQV